MSPTPVSAPVRRAVTGRDATPAANAVAGPWGAWLWGAGLLAVIGIRFAEPILDGDLFWHMAYARQMLARGTLVLDHQTFSWTPTSNVTIYCAWASQLLLHALWQTLGPSGLFALRYAIVLVAAGLFWSCARRAGVDRTALAPFLLLVLVLASPAGTLVKAELFSFLFLHVVLCLYFRAKLAGLEGGAPSTVFYAVPVVLALWVNHHGGFVLVAPFLAATAVGEVLNRRFSPGLGFSRPSLGHLLRAWGLCAVAVVLTPYGVRYPIQLFGDYVLGWTPRPDTAWNAAHRTIFDPTSLGLHFAEYLVLMGALVVVLVACVGARTAPGRRVDWAIVLANVAYGALYVPLLRTTYLWPAVVVYSAVSLLRAAHGSEPGGAPVWLTGSRVGRALGGLALGLTLFLGVRTVSEARWQAGPEGWLGFGVGYVNPVAEAEFLARARVGPRLYNIFDSGGYLLWRLDPEYKVMTDSRSFPYLSWFDDQYRFTVGESFRDFLAKYPADVAVIALVKDGTVRNFLAAPDWRLVYYGPTAAVFVRDTVRVPAVVAGTVAPDRFRDLRSPPVALRVFDFAVLVGDFPTAWEVLDQLEARLAWGVEPTVLRAALAYREAHRALRAGDHTRALQLFERGLRGPVISRRDALILQRLRQAATGAPDTELPTLAAPGA